MNIRDGVSCSDAKKDFIKKGEIALNSIAATYISMTEKCGTWSSPDDVSKLKAKLFLEDYGMGSVDRKIIAKK